jgi:fructokinase
VILVIGEILFDVFPNYKRLGGAPFNFAYHLKNLDFDVRFISRVGKDAAGNEILQTLEQCDFDLGDIQLDDVHPTGTVNVQLDENGVPKFDIIPDVAYDYIEFIPEIHAELLSESAMIYFGSLVQRSKVGYKSLQDMIARKSPATLGFYDINLRPDCYNGILIKDSLLHTTILKLNAEELDKLKQLMFFTENHDAFIHHLMETYSINIVSLTKGEMGSELYTLEDHFSADTVEEIKVVDSVGAGDAYAAMLSAGILRDWPPEEILQRASMFAARICKIKGAVPDSPSFYEPFKPLVGKGRKNAIS